MIEPDHMPRVALEIVNDRRAAMAALLRDHGYLAVGELCKRLKISEATARRDLAALSREHQVRRTFGGALIDFDRQFISFHDRKPLAARSKAMIAKAALKLIRRSSTIFLDSGTTIFALAEAIRTSGLTDLRVVTNNLPVAENLEGTDGIEVFLVGGRFLGRQSVMLGDEAAAALPVYGIDFAFIGAEAFDGQGIWNTSPAVVSFQRAAIGASKRHAFCLDKTKLGQSGAEHLAAWKRVDHIVTDADESDLKQHGARLKPRQIIGA